MSRPANEERICRLVMQRLGELREEEIEIECFPDKRIRSRQAVDVFFKTSSQRFALEHTLVESFAKQIDDGHVFAQLLGPLEEELTGKLPRYYHLTVSVGVARVPRSRHDEIRSALRRWILTVAPALEAEEDVGPEGHCTVTTAPDGVPFEVTLHCSHGGNRLLVFQRVKGDLNSMRRDRVSLAIDRKSPKLLTAKLDGRVSILALEFDDPVLGDRRAIMEAVSDSVRCRSNAPDVILLIRTSSLPWKAWIERGSNLLCRRRSELAGPLVLS